MIYAGVFAILETVRSLGRSAVDAFLWHGVTFLVGIVLARILSYCYGVSSLQWHYRLSLVIDYGTV